MQNFLFSLFLTLTSARVHHFTLKHERRARVALSTFGYTNQGLFHVNLTLDAKDGILVNDQFGFTFDKSTTYGNSKRIEQEEDAEEFYRQSCVLDIGEKANEELNKQNKAREARDLSNDAEFDGFPVGQSENEDRIIFNIKLLKEGPQLWITKSKGLEKGIVVKSRADKEVEFEEVSWDDRQWLVAGYDLQFANGGQDKSKLEIVTTIEITDESQAAIYEYNFQDCVDRQAKHEEVNTNIDINGKLTEKNAHSFLSAGQIPLPEAYRAFTILDFFHKIYFQQFVKYRSFSIPFHNHPKIKRPSLLHVHPVRWRNFHLVFSRSQLL